MTTRAPARARASAAKRPAGPAPMTAQNGASASLMEEPPLGGVFRCAEWRRFTPPLAPRPRFGGSHIMCALARGKKAEMTVKALPQIDASAERFEFLVAPP